MIGPRRLSSVCGVDSGKDDHRDVRDVLTKHGECLVVGDAQGELGHRVHAEGCGREHVDRGMWSGFAWKSGLVAGG